VTLFMLSRTKENAVVLHRVGRVR